MNEEQRLNSGLLKPEFSKSANDERKRLQSIFSNCLYAAFLERKQKNVVKKKLLIMMILKLTNDLLEWGKVESFIFGHMDVK